MLKHLKNLLIIVFISIWVASLCYNPCSAKIKIKERALPSCTSAGALGCPKGFKPSCPKDFEPACVFVLNKQIPSCYEKSGKVYNYFADKISCIEIGAKENQKSKASK